jgi:20S proteasome subunit beta 2
MAGLADVPYGLPSRGGFQFDNVQRNALLSRLGMTAPKAIKTGTTIAGIVFKDGIMLGADTRATEGPIVADKNCEKIHYIADNIYCCGAGTAADTENVTGMISRQMELHRLATSRRPRVTTALTLTKQHLFKYQGHISAALVLGGVDVDGPQLFTIHPAGSTDKLPYVTMGSGSLAAMSIFESRWKPNMSFEEARDLVADAIRAGIFNDLGSGSNVDLTAILVDGTVKVMRNFDKPNPKPPMNLDYSYKPGTTAVLTREIKPLRELATVTEGDAMQV